jgi:hypothetical protein
MTPATDERIARLYGLPLERFTAERNALAAELRAEGDSEAAAAVKALRKPSAAAWAVNQLVRAEPDLVEALLGAGGELRQAHRQAASGKGALQLRAASESERAAVERLLSRAHQAVGRPLSAATLDAVRNSLHAASSDDHAREQIRTGTLTAELRPIGLGPVPAGIEQQARGRGPTAAEKKRRAELAQVMKAAKSTESALQREVDSATRALERAEQVYARAREAADSAAERAQDARQRLREARDGLAEAQRRRADLETGS